MRIGKPRVESYGERRRVAADIEWEDVDRPPAHLHFDVGPAFRGRLVPRSETFLVATLPLAAWLGERRIVVEGSVCPQLLDGLNTAVELLDLWWEPCRGVHLSATEGVHPPTPAPARRTASFLSGGVDAIALLRANRDAYPPDHPGRIRECLVVFGLNRFEFAGGRPVEGRIEAFRRYVASLERLAEAAGVRLVPVHTNVRTLYPGFRSWYQVGLGAGLASTALALSPRYTDVWIASDGEYVGAPTTNDPLLSTCYSTAATRLQQGQVGMPRLRKLELVAGWKPGLRVLRTCLERTLHPDGLPNCGRCEKCVRTMVALAAIGELERARTYPADRLTRSMVRGIEVRELWERRHLADCVHALRERGRNEEAGWLNARIVRYDRRRALETSLVGRAFRRVGSHLFRSE